MKNFFKKICSLAILSMVLLTVGSTSTSFAQPSNPGSTTAGPTSEPTSKSKPPAVPGQPSTNDLFHSFEYKKGTAVEDSKIKIVADIAAGTQGSWSQILGNATRLILAITGAIALTSFTFAGIMLLTARGSEDQLKKGKDMIFLSILALAIIAVSYAFVLGISQLKFG